MATRNFWIEVKIDGRKTQLSGGPRGKDEGFHLEIYQRENNEISLPIEVIATECDGELRLEIIDIKKDRTIFINTTPR